MTWRGGESGSVRGRALALAAALLLWAGLAQAAPVSGQGTWETTLKARDINGNALTSLTDPAAMFFYDTALNITWLADANVNGRMSWANADAWAEGLTVGEFTDWRLPEVKPVNGTSFQYVLLDDGTADWGYNIGAPGTKYEGSTASELAHLYYVTLGNLAWCSPVGTCPQLGWGLNNTGPFRNLQSAYYWFGTEYARNPNFAWHFHTTFGSQYAMLKTDTSYALAVRPGDVLRAAAVPEPSALALLLPLLGALLWGRQRAD